MPRELLMAETVHGLDLRQACVVLSPSATAREQKAALVLVEEAEKRCGLRWPVSTERKTAGGVAIYLATHESSRGVGPDTARGSRHAETGALGEDGFLLRSGNNAGNGWISVTGGGERGLLFGVGKLLRSIDFGRQTAELAGVPLHVASSPEYRLRGHQLGYRPKTNAYDGWSVAMFDQYIRDLAMFGVNAIELIPPHSDDLPDSPHFVIPPQQMMVALSGIADSYGLDVWVWYPAMARDYGDAATVEKALAEWKDTLSVLPRVNAVFVPGGDPGHTEPHVLLALLQKQKAHLRQYHPGAALWVSPQGFDAAWMESFLGIVRQPDTQQWLDGIVFGPMSRLSETQLRQAVPVSYPIRCYPDITHSLQCQYPVPDWDVALALTEGREVINPRPRGHAAIAREVLPGTLGFITYSEGCNDDVNKFVWSALGWDSKQDVTEVLRDFAHYFVGRRETEGFAEGVLALETNWRGPLATNGGVEVTLQQFRDLENSASPAVLENWRFQQTLYRAYFDAFVQRRLLLETAQVQRARDILGTVLDLGWGGAPLNIGGSAPPLPPNGLLPEPLLAKAQAVLEKTVTQPGAPLLRSRIGELGEALFQSIHMQLAVERYAAEAVSRAANLDTLDTPVTDAMWLRRQILAIRAMTDPMAQITAMRALLPRTDPGPGGFYDALGDVMNRPHLVAGVGGAKDPDFRDTALVGFSYPDVQQDHAPVAWKCWAESLYDAPLVMRYEGLDRQARYRLRVVHSGDSPHIKLRLMANDAVEIHPYIERTWPPAVQEFPIPESATARGELKLAWNREPGLGGSGSGCQVAEVWLVLEPELGEDARKASQQE